MFNFFCKVLTLEKKRLETGDFRFLIYETAIIKMNEKLQRKKYFLFRIKLRAEYFFINF